MKTFNIEANMKRAVPRSRRSGITPLKRGVNEMRTATAALLPLLLSLVWLALPGKVLAPPANYTDETVVANYVKGMLYWRTDSTSNNIAAFRYKHSIYVNDGALRANATNIANFYGTVEIARAQSAENDLRRGLTNNPASTLLRGLLLDIYYDRAAAQLLVAGNLLCPVERMRLGPPSVPTGLVIDDEISLYRQGMEAYRSALAGYFALLTDNLGMTDVPPAGYQCFQHLVPIRGLEPAYYLSNNTPVSVVGSTNVLFAGYKDLVLLDNGLRDYGRAALALTRLQAWRNNSGESYRFLFLHANALLGIFPSLDPRDTSAVDASSGLAEAIQAVSDCRTDLETLRQTLTGNANLLGFESDFLMLAQKYAGQSGDIFDSFDALQLRLDPTDLSSPLSYAKELQAEAYGSYSDYRGYQDQLEAQLANVTGSAEDRLFQIVGARLGTPEYDHPENNNGCEIWQQIQSIEGARLGISRNQAEIDNLKESVQIEIQRSAAVSNVTIHFANYQADLTTYIGHISAAQAAAQAAADAFNSATWWGAGANGVNAVVQAAGEEAKGQLNAEKERQAGIEQAKIEGLETEARVKTMLLDMNTLTVDSQEAALMLKQEMGRLTALLREKADLEDTLAESDQDMADRYFADPVHHLRYLHQTMLANLSFDEAQKWLYFMSRALEYKWNTPFMNYFYLGRRWSSSTLFKLRNAEELTQFYNAMVSFNSLVQLPQDDYWDAFSVREDFLGYRLTNDLGQVLYYADPANPSGPTNLTALEAFHSYLRSKTNAVGNIVLNFSTRREKAGGTFYRGPRFDANLQTVLSAGLFLDKIRWMNIRLVGNHSLHRDPPTLAGELTYGGSSFVRNFDVGHFVPGRPDRLQDEETVYSTRYWYFHAPSASWRFSRALKSPVTMVLTNNAEMPPTVAEIDVFKERSVATTGWVLSIPTQDLGVPVLRIDELDDVKIWFYHFAVSRQMPEGAAAAAGVKTATRNIPFPYYLRYQPNPEEGGK
jgi:hypothetical protein